MFLKQFASEWHLPCTIYIRLFADEHALTLKPAQLQQKASIVFCSAADARTENLRPYVCGWSRWLHPCTPPDAIQMKREVLGRAHGRLIVERECGSESGLGYS